MDQSSLKGTVFGLPRIRTLSATVVGAGALGNEVIKALGLLGVRRMVVVDPDTVEPGNLNRSLFFRTEDFAERNKAEAIAETASALFPDTEFFAIPREIADTSNAVLTETEILFSCVDSDLARLEIAYLSTAFDIPVAEGGLGSYRASHGRATWFAGSTGACYGCKLPANRRRELLTLWQANPQSCRIPEENKDVPSTPTMAAIIGSLQVELGLKNLLAAKAESESIELHLEASPRLDHFENRQAAECPFHTRPTEIRLVAKENETAESVLLASKLQPLSKAYVRLDWPVCTRARCLCCGDEWAPMMRAGSLRRYGTCPNCRASDPLMLSYVQTVAATGPWASLPLSHFGVVTGQWLSVRVG